MEMQYYTEDGVYTKKEWAEKLQRDRIELLLELICDQLSIDYPEKEKGRQPG
jgi:hypothetical protein